MLVKKYKPASLVEFLDLDFNLKILVGSLDKDFDTNLYAFIGPSGSGKTVLAELFARLYLCAKRNDSESCGTCLSCQAFKNGNNPSFKSVSAYSFETKEDFEAFMGSDPSFTGVLLIDDAEALSFEIQKSIISLGAKDTLFIVCADTSESFSNEFSSNMLDLFFSYPSYESLIEMLSDVCSKEGFDNSNEALEKIAHHSGGNVRKALMIVEQVSFLGDINILNVNKLLFLDVSKSYSTLLHNLQNPDKVYTIINELIKRLNVRSIYEGLADYALKSYCVDNFNTVLRNKFDKKLLAFSKQLNLFSRTAETASELVCDLLLLEDFISSNKAYRDMGDRSLLSRTSSRTLMQKNLIKPRVNTETKKPTKEFSAEDLAGRLGVKCRKIGG